MRVIATLLILAMLLAAPAMAASGTVRIWGTNVANAQSNTSVNLAPQNITIAAFDGNTTTFYSTVNNATDTLTFSIANQTIGRVMELRINGTVINGYQVNSTGWVSFTRTQLTSNQTYKLTPAVNVGGYNMTWAKIWNGAPISTNFSLNCAFNTVYQNTNDTAMFVSYAAYSDVDANIGLFSDSSNPPVLSIAYDLYEITQYNRAILHGWIMPGDYYKLITDAGTGVLSNCRGWR